MKYCKRCTRGHSKNKFLELCMSKKEVSTHDVFNILNLTVQ